MKVAISSAGPGLDAQVDPRLGRCTFLIIADPDTLKYEAVENENRMLGGGAGIQTARTITEKGAGVVLTGNCGPNAFQTLSAAGIRIIVGVAGTVREALERYKRGEMTPVDQPSVESHFGMGAQGPVSPQGGDSPSFPRGGFAGRGMGMGRGMGRGMGGGMGGGRGRGMGRGVGMGSGPGFGTTASGGEEGALPSSSGQEEVAALKQQVEQLKELLDEALSKIKKLGES